MPRSSGIADGVVITSKLYAPGDTPTISVPQNALSHQIMVDGVDASTGTAPITLTPVGASAAIPLYESDGTTPVVMDMTGVDVRSNIVGSIQSFTVTPATYNGTGFKVTTASYSR